MSNAFREFVIESWRIEGLTLDEPTLTDRIEDHCKFVRYAGVTVEMLSELALTFTNGRGQLRSRGGMDVRVGDHIPKRGGPGIVGELEDILHVAHKTHPYDLHQQFERLHPFIDGNGRTGRLLWLWRMHKAGLNWKRLGFLHAWYYQSLERYDVLH